VTLSAEQRAFAKKQLWRERDIVRQNADWLLNALFSPSAHGAVARDLPAEIAKEPVNWGDLGVGEVRRLDGDTWLIEIEEADPDCPALQGYVRKWMSAWGFHCEVRTEW
jgi:hypothetical protein